MRLGKSDFLNPAVNREVSVRVRVENEVNNKKKNQSQQGELMFLNKLEFYKLSFLQDFLKSASRRENLNRI